MGVLQKLKVIGETMAKTYVSSKAFYGSGMKKAPELSMLEAIETKNKKAIKSMDAAIKRGDIIRIM